MSSDDSLVDRISSFVSGNKRGIAIGAAAAAIAVGGVAYYVASSRAGSGAGDEESPREGKKKDKKKKKHRKSAKDKDGPIWEERKPKATEESSDDGCVPVPSLLRASFARSLTFPPLRVPDQPLTEEQIQALGTAVSLSSRLGFDFLPVVMAHPTNAGAQVARGVAEAKGQRRVQGPKAHPRHRILHARDRRVAPTRARVLQQPRRVLRQHGTATARKSRGGLRRGAQARLALRQSAQQEGDRAGGS